MITLLRTKLSKENSDIPILYKEDYLLIANKPAGIPVHPTLDTGRVNFSDELQKQESLKYLRLVNRIDLETSGIVVCCINTDKNKEADELLKKSNKEYLCIVEGIITRDKFRLESHLKDSKNGNVVTVYSGGKKAITDFKLISTNKKNNTSVLLAKLHTGRRHQIRVQLSDIDYPILGDKIYSTNKKNISRCMLHSYRFAFQLNKQDQLIICEPPEDLKKYLETNPALSRF